MLSRLSYPNRWWVVAAVALVYFIVFPDDVRAIVLPLETLLAVSYSISPWLYGLAAVALVCWTLRRIYLVPR